MDLYGRLGTRIGLFTPLFNDYRLSDGYSDNT